MKKALHTAAEMEGTWKRLLHKSQKMKNRIKKYMSRHQNILKRRRSGWLSLQKPYTDWVQMRLNEEASAKIYAAKGRPSDNPLIVHIADTKALEELSCDVTAQAKASGGEVLAGTAEP